MKTLRLFAGFALALLMGSSYAQWNLSPFASQAACTAVAASQAVGTWNCTGPTTAPTTVAVVVAPPVVVTTSSLSIKTNAGLCIDATAPNAVVQQACTGGSAQLFDDLSKPGQFVQGSNCLGASLNANGVQLSMVPCTSKSASTWTRPSGTLKHSGGRCADIPGSSVSVAGAKVQLWDCDNSGEQKFTVGGTVSLPAPTGASTCVSCTGVTSAMWSEIASQRTAFSDPNDCKNRVDALPISGGTTLAPGGNIVTALANNAIVFLQTGTYSVNAKFGVTAGKKLLAAPGQKPVIDLAGVSSDDWWAIAVGDNSVLAGIEVKNAPGIGLITFNFGGSTYANGGLIYNVSVHDNGMDGRSVDNGTGVYVTGGAQNWCVVSTETYNTYNVVGGASTANGGNSDGFSNNFGASGNTFIDVHAHHTGDDGFDMWQGGSSYWYFSDANNAGKVPGKTNNGDGNGVKLGTGSVAHKFYKSTATNNKAGGFNLNGNTMQPVLVQSTASGNPGGDYMNGVIAP